MTPEHLLALDLGTTGVRALVVSTRSEVLARAYQPLSTVYPRPGWVEQDPVEMWQRSVAVMRQAIGQSGREACDLAGIGVVTQRATVVAWDRATGEPLAPAISWQDQRTAERVAGFRRLGIPLNTLASATKLEWWLANDAAIRKAAAAGSLRLGTPDSWLTARLSAGTVHVTDPGNASSTALFDGASGCWSDALLGTFGVPPELLPEIVPTSGIVAETPRDLLGASLPVAARAGDQQAAAFAQGVHAEGEAKLTLGTSGMLDLHTGSEMRPPVPGTYPLVLWQLSDGTRAFCLEGTVITAGAAVDWLVHAGLLEEAAGLDAVAREAESSEGVTFVPALQGLGTPFLDDDATALLGGLTRGTGREPIVRAVLEGIAHRCVDICEALRLGAAPLRVDGGLARSEILLQSIADLGGREIHRAAETETTAMGAAHLAGLATGVFESPAACRSAVAAPDCFRPGVSPSERAASRERWARALARTGGRQEKPSS